ncbi:MAG TPA: SGNH/GDSL hydrolase family protein [Armatimonadota bacterium]|nr:SGNH/GDSL hydrolase family protein [Armatimonadota bacterium]
MDRRRFCGLAVSALGALALEPRLPAGAAQPAGFGDRFFFKDGDRVVMIGDSITEQHLHSNYVEIYTLSRFPQWNLTFRNVGIGGDTSTGGNRRTERDVLSFKPTAVTITFGMNDAGYRNPHDPVRLEAYRTGLQGMADKLKPQGVRVAILSASPVEKMENGPALEGYNQTLEIFAATAREVATRSGFVFVDQFHPHVAALQKARDASPGQRINGGDAVHPGPSGQLLMAWAILKGLNAPSLVSSATLNATRKRSSTKVQNCAVTEVRRRSGGVSFVRTDKALPLWIAAEARPILQWAPIVEELDQYLLTVRGLQEGSYDLVIDGEKTGTVSAAELEAGYNMALLTDGPIARQAKAVHDAVFAKNKYYHDQIFRGVVLNNAVPEADKSAMIDERMKGMPALETAIREALVLKPHRFEVVKS